MKTRQKLTNFVKALFKASLKAGIVDEVKVHQLLKLLEERKPPGTLQILKIYKGRIQTALAKETVTVEIPTKIKNQPEIERRLQKTGAQKILFRINPQIVFGAKITSGDWIWDATLDAKLRKLTNAE